MNNNIAEQLHKTLESPDKCPTCRWNTPAYGDEFIVHYCYRKWFLNKGCEYAIAVESRYSEGMGVAE